MADEINTIQVRAVLETSYDSNGDALPSPKEYPVLIQITEKIRKNAKFAADADITGITLLTQGVPDAPYYTLIYTHHTKEYRDACRISGGKLMSRP
jgi:hypothetical protein